MLKVVALHTGNAHGANFLPIRQDTHGSLGRILDGKQGIQFGVGADPVIVTVGRQQAAVKANLTALASRQHRQLGGQEILLNQAIFLVQQLHDVQLHQISALAIERLSAQNHVQLLTLDALGQGLLHLIAGQMDQQIGDHQHRVIVVLTDGHGDYAAVLAVDYAMQGQGHGGPLILLDAAVVVGLEVGNLRILVQGIGLHVQPGGVHMGGADIGTLGKGLGADHCQSNGLVPVIVVDFIAGLRFHAGSEGLEPPLLRLTDGPGGGFPLGLAGIHKGHVAAAVGVHFFPLLG